MNLVVDIGNSAIKIALFEGNVLRQVVRQTELDTDTLEELLENNGVKNIILSSVRREKSIEFGYLQQSGRFVVELSHLTPLPIVNNYQTPETLGRDRIAGVVGAAELLPHQNSLVIDAGTCITYDFITAEKKYLGGNISPGLMMRYRAMHEFTAALPLLDKQRLEGLVGYSTITAMRSGVEHGIAFEIEGFIQQYSNNFGLINVFMTGGDAQYLAAALKTKVFVQPDLVLIGLNKILIHNAKLLE
jgi:type III pantothenate kinase